MLRKIPSNLFIAHSVGELSPLVGQILGQPCLFLLPLRHTFHCKSTEFAKHRFVCQFAGEELFSTHNQKREQMLAWYGMIWYGMVWYGMVWYGMVWYGMVWYGMVWYGMVWYGMVWYGMVWYGMVW